MLVTTAAFFALTLALVAWQIRSRAAHEGAAPARTCPRCHAPLRDGATRCGACLAPLQAFEMVTAPLARPEAGTESGPQHAMVRADLCVGCGGCVDACPEPGAIRLEQKLAVVNVERCKGHGRCVAACPVGGILLTSGEAVQRVEVPELTVDFESNVPGLYVVGELGGRGLIKNAVNEGRLAAEHCARALGRPGARADGDPEAFDLVIVGSGPAGLSASLEALKAGLRYLVLEQGTLADTIARYPRRKVLFAEPLRVPLYGELWVADATKETLLQIWQNVIRKNRLNIATGRRVSTIRREGRLFQLETGQGSVRARRVILAMGRRGTPRRLGVPGEELDKVFYDIVEMEAFAGQRALVVGGGDSAIESAVGLSLQPDTPVTLSYRGAEFGRAKERNREKLGQAVDAGRVTLLLESQVREIRRELVVLEDRTGPRLVPNDVVIVRIGGEAPYPFLERIGVNIVRKEIALPPPAHAGEGTGR